MTNSGDAVKTALRAASPLIVTRSTVEQKSDYRQYKPELRKDFWHSCAYCTLCESEAGGHRFTIDHYEPKSVRPELETRYENLFYACDTCNEMKGDRSPPLPARADGHRFFRSDEDDRSEHFEQKGILLRPKTNTGSFTIDACNLNRTWLRKLRELRRRLWDCEKFAEQGVMFLRTFKIDQIPPEIRSRAQFAIEKATKTLAAYQEDVEGVLRGYAMSTLLEDGEVTPEEKQRRLERLDRLKALEKKHPESWRPGRKKSR